MGKSWLVHLFFKAFFLGGATMLLKAIHYVLIGYYSMDSYSMKSPIAHLLSFEKNIYEHPELASAKPAGVSFLLFQRI